MEKHRNNLFLTSNLLTFNQKQQTTFTLRSDSKNEHDSPAKRQYIYFTVESFSLSWSDTIILNFGLYEKSRFQ